MAFAEALWLHSGQVCKFSNRNLEFLLSAHFFAFITKNINPPIIDTNNMKKIIKKGSMLFLGTFWDFCSGSSSDNQSFSSFGASSDITWIFAILLSIIIKFWNNQNQFHLPMIMKILLVL